MNIDVCAGAGQRECSLQRDKAKVETSSDLMISFGFKIEH